MKPSPLKTHFSLMAVEAEARADLRIYRRMLATFIERETTNSYLAQFVFGIIAIAGYCLRIQSVLLIGAIHFLVDHLVRQELARISLSLRRGEIDEPRLRHIEHAFYGVGFVWAMAAWPLAESLDGLRLLLTVVSVAGLLVMANTTCFAPRVFRASVIGFALGIAVAIPAITTIPEYVLGSASAAFLVVVTSVGTGTARQLMQMLQMQVERDEAIDGHQRTIAALDSARRAATHMAQTDSLTGLANRLRFMAALDERIAREEPFSLTLLDVDFFKNINDVSGHNTGDEVLKSLGRAFATMEDCFGFAARLGGDEFALIADRHRNQMSGDEIISSVNQRMDDLRSANLNLPPVSVTGGSACFPRDAENKSDLLAAADIAQRAAKKVHRGGHLDYCESLADAFRRETEIAHAINQTIAARDLFLYFQPKINLQTGAVVGAEALARFAGESLCTYSLEEIFEAAERRGLGVSLDELVLDRYRQALVALRDEFSIMLPTSVNLSGAILKTPQRLLAKLNELIADGLAPSLIRLEITENAIYGRGQVRVAELLCQIVELGFSLALDDFGTGSGALRQLVSLPVSEIKIDKTFVSGMRSDPRNGAIIKGLIVTGREMGVDIVAEGVEAEVEAQLLRSMGAQFAQGYLWSRALPIPPLVEFVCLFCPNFRLKCKEVCERCQQDCAAQEPKFAPASQLRRGIDPLRLVASSGLS